MSAPSVERPSARPAARRSPVRRVLAATRLVAPVGLALAAVCWLLPPSIGTTWAGIGAELALVHLWWFPVALLVWLAGLAAQTRVQTSSLPGLSARRALLLNATGSAVSNLAPLGGALGMETNRRMVRGWGFSHPAFAGYVALTNLVALLTKLLLPCMALLLMLQQGVPTGPVRTLAAVAASALALVLLALSGRLPARLADRGLATVLAAGRIVLRRPPQPSAPWVSALRADCATLTRRFWRSLLTGTLAYHVLQGLLLAIALQAVGATPTAVAVVTALAVERAATLLVVLPAGLGVAEVAAATALVGLGVAPAAAAAGLLLHRLFVVVLEVPLGLGLGGLWWLNLRRTGGAPLAAA